MKKLLVVLVVLKLLSACDKIEQPLADEDISTEGIQWDDTSYASLDNNQKIVLYEEFTGHTCQQCPAGNELLESISTQNPGQMIVVSIHAGFFAQTQDNPDGSYSTDHSSEEGEEYATNFGVITNPVALVNRSEYNGSITVNTGNWEPAFDFFYSASAPCSIEMTTLYDDSSKTVQVRSEFDWNLSPSGSVSYQLYLTESNVVDWQKDGTENIENYRHNHLLRKAVNGTWGTEVVMQDSVYTYSTQIQESWNPDQLQVVGFLYDPNSYEVFQVNVTRVR